MLNLADVTVTESSCIVEPNSEDWLRSLIADPTTASRVTERGSAIDRGWEPTALGEQVHSVWKMRVRRRLLTENQSVVFVGDGPIQRIVNTREDQDANLVAALHDLDGSIDEAHEEGFRPPSDVAIDNARRVLESMFQTLPRRYEIYPTPDAEVAIDAPGGPGASVIVLCESGGAALCLVNIGDRQRRARYSSVDTLPDGFVQEALLELQGFGSRPR